MFTAPERTAAVALYHAMSRRILIVVNRIPYPLADGGALAIHAMIQGYHDAGWQVFLLAMNTSRHYVDAQTCAALYPELYAFETVTVDNRIRLWPLMRNLLFRRTPEHADRFDHRGFREKLKSVLASFRPNVVQFESIYLNVYRDVFDGGELLVQRLHNIEWQIWDRLADETRHPLKRWYLYILARRIRRFEEQAWRDADLLLPITTVDDRIIAASGSNIPPRLVTPFGLDFNAADGVAMGMPVSDWQGYHIAAMDWRPNQDAMEWFVSEVWPLVRRAVPQFRFSFAGRSMPHHLSAGLPDGVTCAGAVPDATAFIRDKQILLVPLRSGGGIRVKILEAMAAGKLVVSTTVGMQGIDAIPGVHFLRADTPEEFCEAIQHVFSHPDIAIEIAKQGHSFVVTHYSQQEIMNRLVEVIAKLSAARS